MNDDFTPTEEELALPIEDRIPLYLDACIAYARAKPKPGLYEDEAEWLAYQWTTDDTEVEDAEDLEECHDLDALMSAACERFGF